MDSLQALVGRYENEPERAAIGVDTLAPVLDSLAQAAGGRAIAVLVRALQTMAARDLREDNKRSPATDSWLSRWLDEHPLPEVVRWGLIYGSIALVVLLALAIIINEVRTAARGRRHKSAAEAAGAVDLPGTAGPAALELDAGGERPSALLRMLIATLVKTGRLNGAQSLTHRELTKRARFDDSTQRESFQKIAQLAEREVFSGQDVASDDLGEALRVGRSLDAQLKGGDMKDRLLTLALAIGAFVAFYAVMAPKPSAPQEQATRPTSTEGGPNGYLGLVRWLESERVPVLSLRERFTKLSDVRRARIAHGQSADHRRAASVSGARFRKSCRCSGGCSGAIRC